MAKRNTTTKPATAAPKAAPKAPKAAASTNPLATHAAALTNQQAAHAWGLLAATGILPKAPAAPTGAALSKALAGLAAGQVAQARRMLGNSPGNNAIAALLMGPATATLSNAKAMAGLLQVTAAQVDSKGYFTGLTNAHHNWYLVPLVAGNPKSSGSQTASRWDNYKFGATLADNLAVKGGGNRQDFKWDLAHHLVGLVDPAAYTKASKVKATSHTSKVGKGKPVTLAGPAPASASPAPAPAPAPTAPATGTGTAS